MKKLTIITISILLMGFLNVFSQESKNLEGVWKLTYEKWEFPDTTIENTQFENPQYKIFTEKHVSTSFLNEEDSFSGHFGTYSFDEDSYVEHIEFSSFNMLIGESLEYKSKIVGDKWEINGEFGNQKMKQTWLRVK